MIWFYCFIFLLQINVGCIVKISSLWNNKFQTKWPNRCVRFEVSDNVWNIQINNSVFVFQFSFQIINYRQCMFQTKSSSLHHCQQSLRNWFLLAFVHIKKRSSCCIAYTAKIALETIARLNETFFNHLHGIQVSCDRILFVTVRHFHYMVPLITKLLHFYDYAGKKSVAPNLSRSIH